MHVSCISVIIIYPVSPTYLRTMRNFDWIYATAATGHQEQRRYVTERFQHAQSSSTIVSLFSSRARTQTLTSSKQKKATFLSFFSVPEQQEDSNASKTKPPQPLSTPFFPLSFNTPLSCCLFLSVSSFPFSVSSSSFPFSQRWCPLKEPPLNDFYSIYTLVLSCIPWKFCVYTTSGIIYKSEFWYCKDSNSIKISSRMNVMAS